VVVVIAATVTLLYVRVYEAQSGDSYFPSSLLPSTVIVEPFSPLAYDGLDQVEGVEAVAPAWIGYTRNGYSMLVTDCMSLDLVVKETMPRCRAGDAYVNGTLYDENPLRPTMRIHLDRAPRLRVTVPLTRVQRADIELGGFFHHDILVPTESTSLDLSSRAVPSVIYLATDGDPATVERVRNALYGPLAPSVSTRGEPEDYADEVPALVGGAVTLGLLITFAIAAATMLITTVDAVGERRRSLATLAAVGASRGVLRRALAVETALPMLAGVALGLGSAIAGTWMMFKAVTAYEGPDQAPPIYWGSLGVVLTFAIAATVVATVATFPSLGRAIRPESLRTE
jgi:hypothetical protein